MNTIWVNRKQLPAGGEMKGRDTGGLILKSTTCVFEMIQLYY